MPIQTTAAGIIALAQYRCNRHAVGIPSGTHVFTLDGLTPVDQLEPGARVITRSGAMRLRSILADGDVYHLGFAGDEVVLTENGHIPAPTVMQPTLADPV